MLFVCLFLLLLTVSVSADYIPAPVNIVDPRIKLSLRLVGSSSVVYNDSIYVYGGAVSINIQNVSSTLYKYELNEKTFKFDLSMVNATNTGPQCLFCQPIHLPGTTKLLVLTVDIFNMNTDTLFSPYEFDFATLTWTNLRGQAHYNYGTRGNTTYESRFRHNVVLGNDGKVYIVGGRPIYEVGMLCPRTIISYDPDTHTFDTLPKDAPFCLDSAVSYTTQDSTDEINFLLSNLDNGTVYTKDSNTYSYYGVSNITSPQTLLTLNTSTGDWSEHAIGGYSPSYRYDSTAQYNPQTRLLHIFGGRYDDPTTEELYLNNDVYTLDTTRGNLKWYNYSFEDDTNTIVEMRAGATSAILKNKYFVTLFGETIVLGHDVSLSEIDVFEIPSNFSYSSDNYPMILRTLPPPKPVKHGVSVLALPKIDQFLIVVAVVAAILLLWIFIVYLSAWCGKIDSGTEVLVKMLYDPRIGEPVWTEVLHCIVKIIAFVIFVLYIVYCYDNIANTTISTTSKTETLDNITYPDIRFCVTKWNFTAASSSPSYIPITCTVKGESMSDKLNCTGYLHYLDSDTQSPLYEFSNSDTQCWMFKSNSSLVSTAERPTLSFGIENDPSLIGEGGIIYASIYPVNESPLRYIFFDEPLPDEWSQDDLEKWAQFGDNSVQALKTFGSMSYNDSLSITFDTKTHQNLNPYGAWNYIGNLFPSYLPTENFTQTYEHQGQVPAGATIEISPDTFDKEIITYKRDSTILGAIATAGGILGLMTTIIILIFGSRPFSAWGLIHIAFRNRHERMLSDTLDARLFKNNDYHMGGGHDEEIAQVPLATPVDSRFLRAFNEINQLTHHEDKSAALQDSDEVKDMEKRIMRLEARNQMMEIVLKAYYIDDQIFHTLNQQRESNPLIGRSPSTHYSTKPTAEGGDVSPPSFDADIDENIADSKENPVPKRRLSDLFRLK